MVSLRAQLKNKALFNLYLEQLIALMHLASLSSFCTSRPPKVRGFWHPKDVVKNSHTLQTGPEIDTVYVGTFSQNTRMSNE